MIDKAKEIVNNYIDANSEELKTLLKSFVNINTTNPGDGIHGNEKELQDFISSFLQSEGFEVHTHAYDDEGNRPNVIGILKGTGKGKSVIFNGHADVVPIAFPDRWKTPPFIATEKDGKIFGRGTSDMKGGLAAAMFAMCAIKRCGLETAGDVLLESVVGEESQSAETYGTAKVTQEGYRADFAISCEPSALEIQIASPALIFFKLIVEGKGVHVSARNQMLYPQSYGLPCGNEIAVDAFEKSLPLVDYIKRFENQINLRYRDEVLGGGGVGGHDKQGVGIFTINPARIEGGEYLGTVPSRMEYTYSVWYPDQLVSRDEIIGEIRKGVEAIASTDDYLKDHLPVIECPVIQDWPGFRLPLDHPAIEPMKKAVREGANREPVISEFKAVCDAHYLSRDGIPSLVLGPGALFNSVHADNEFVVIDDLIDAAKIYANFILNWCK